MSFIMSCIMLFVLDYAALCLYNKRHKPAPGMMTANPFTDVSLQRRKKEKKGKKDPRPDEQRYSPEEEDDDEEGEE